MQALREGHKDIQLSAATGFEGVGTPPACTSGRFNQFDLPLYGIKRFAATMGLTTDRT
jgi:hypothetical protein